MLDNFDAPAAEAVLLAANAAYHADGEPTMIDADYDALKRALASFYEAAPDRRPPLSVLDVVGAPVRVGARQARHIYPMLSLSNAFCAEDVEDFCRSVEAGGPVDLYGELKLDGVSLSLRYEYGRLVRAASRGNGTVGEDTTRSIGRVRGVPAQLGGDLAQLPCVEVRGEVCMLRAVFVALNARLKEAGEELMSNPRNAAAGAMRREVALEGADLDFFVYQVVSPQGPVFARQSQAIAALEGMGFTASPERARFSSAQEAVAWQEEIAHRRADLPMDIDGVVYKVDCAQHAARLGARSNAPRFALAHKFPADKVWTRLRAIDVQVGRTGLLAPVGRLEPIMVGGVVVSNATLHNQDYIEGRDSAGRPIRDGVDIRVGDMVEVYRAGDVIPKVGAVDVQARPANSLPFVFPTHCPACGGAVLREGAEVRCVAGSACAPQRLFSLVHAFGRDALDADGVSEGALLEWISWGWVHTLADALVLEETHGAGSVDPLEGQLGWGPVSAKRAFAALRQARSAPLDRALYALGIPLIGRTTARDLAVAFATWEDMVADALGDAERLAAISGVGPKVIQALRMFWGTPATRGPAEQALGLISMSNPLYREASESAGVLGGWTVVFTGTFPGADRESASARARALGATVAGSVSKKTTLLIAGEKAGSKRAKAESLGVPVLDPQAWSDLAQRAESGQVPDIPQS